MLQGASSVGIQYIGYQIGISDSCSRNGDPQQTNHVQKLKFARVSRRLTCVQPRAAGLTSGRPERRVNGRGHQRPRFHRSAAGTGGIGSPTSCGPPANRCCGARSDKGPTSPALSAVNRRLLPHSHIGSLQRLEWLIPSQGRDLPRQRPS